MSQKYTGLAQQIVELVGGKENISNVYHCATRLRFTLKDENKADKNALESLDGVAKVMFSNGMYQVVIGTEVASVYEEVEKIVGPMKDEGGKEETKKGNVVGRVVDFISGTFMPVIPAISGSGMIKAVLALLMVFHVITSDSQTYYILNFFADAVFYFLPILLAFSAARKLKSDPILAAVIAAIMLHPDWNALVEAGDPVYLFDVIPMQLVNYSASVIPIILIIFIQSYVEKWLNKVIPGSVRLIFVPLLDFLIMGTLALSVLGPIGSVLGGWLAALFTFLSTNAAWIPAVLIGGLLPIMVMFGVHTAVGPLGSMQLAQLGYDSIFGPGCVCSNIAQATSGLAVAIRTKDPKAKTLAASGSITAFMGITEPILYGTNLPKKYPLVAAMIGGACGGLYAGLTRTHRFATGSSGLPAVLLYIGDNTLQYLINICIALAITFVVTFILTWILAGRYEGGKITEENTTEEKTTEESIEGTPLAESARATAAETAGTQEITSPLKGRVKALSDGKDEAFASGAMGQGVVIEPEDGLVTAPFDGTVGALFPTNHAIGLRSDSGLELMIHIGLDTVELNGEGFEAYVRQGDRVRKGDRLVKADLEKIRSAGYAVETPVLVSNSNDYKSVEGIVGEADQNTVILKVEEK
ncbi:MAG: beta-glucoside-specific PTS transporter subunit IIABC [Anaerovoracaceae bacterium]|jgi:PTS system beta-glucosides-specific IIC component